jgi:glutamate carboxypeptidase
MQARGECLFALIATFLCAFAFAQPVEPVWSLAQKEKPAMLDTLKELVNIESGSRELEGLDKIAGVLAKRFEALGAKVELIDLGTDYIKFTDTPPRVGKALRATFTGTGTKNILMLAHMDTVYPRGMLAQQPFRNEGEKVWGLGIADDRHGISVILHSLAILKAMNFRDYGRITVLINPDEEINSPASRHIITQMGSEHDAVMSYEGSGSETDQVRLATAGIAQAVLNITGHASHAGSAPEKGINALTELSHQILQMGDLSDPARNIKVNWTMASAGIVRNMIPPAAQAFADVRVERLSDLDSVEQKLRERIKTQRLKDAQVELLFERTFPPLEPTDAARTLAAHAQRIYSELGKKLAVNEKPTGGGTDAANASLKTKAPVIEGLGLMGFGSHSTNAEYVFSASIEPRLYLTTRMLMDISTGRAPLR